jgi:hypothetical protein
MRLQFSIFEAAKGSAPKRAITTTLGFDWTEPHE